MFQCGFKCASRGLKEVEWVFEGSFQGVSMMFQGNFKVVSRKIERSSESPIWAIQGSFKACRKFKAVSKIS